MSIISSFRNAVQANPTFHWPPREIGPGALLSDAERLRTYNRYRNIYAGNFGLAFPHEVAFAGRGGYVGTNANLTARAVDALHSAIWVSAPAPRSDNEVMELFAHELLEVNRNEQALSDSVRDTVLFGDGILKVSVEDDLLRVQNVAPESYFPEVRNSNPQNPKAHNIIYRPDSDDEDKIRTRERYWFNEETKTWWLTISDFLISTGQELPVHYEVDLRVQTSPIIHTYSHRLSGMFWGKSPMSDAERAAAEYAATLIKIGMITEMASTKALLSAPEFAFSDQGRLVWDTQRPLMIESTEMPNWNKDSYGWQEPPGANIIEPNLKVLDQLEKDVYNSFGLVKQIFGDTGQMRDVGSPGLRRSAILTEQTVRRYQKAYEAFLGDLVNVSAQFSREWLDVDSLPDTYTTVEFLWESFAPTTEFEKAQELEVKMRLGLPKVQALRELGYSNAEELVAQQQSEMEGQLIFPHSPYDPANPDPAIEEGLNRVLEK
jgi:hypothetical protein